MRKISRTNLKKRLVNRGKSSKRAIRNRNLFSLRRLNNLGVKTKRTDLIDFRERKGECGRFFELGTVVRFRGLKGEIYVKPMLGILYELNRKKFESGILIDKILMFRIEDRFFEAKVSKCRVLHGGFYFTIEGLNTRNDVSKLRLSDVLILEELLDDGTLTQFDSCTCMGFKVVNLEGKGLGTVSEIGGSKFQTHFKTSKTIIPNVPGIVREVKRGSKTIIVNWSDGWIENNQ